VAKALLVLGVLLLAGCAAPPAPPGPGSPGPNANVEAPRGAFTATSSAFEDGGAIPEEHTCVGANTSPPLDVRGAPSRAAALALIMGDPDAPASPLAPLGVRNITHWLAWDIPLVNGTATFPAGGVPIGAVEGQNEGGENGYSGPCPPVPGDPHRYMLSFLALDAPLGLATGANRAALEEAMQGHVVGEALRVGVFTRPLPPG
jgi:Raf kinase inhibitor-like YbhB/YbcL family protein